jgi:hypothetical protein
VENVSAKETLFRVERGHRSGRLDESLMGGYMRWDCSRTWEYLLNNREDLCRRYADHHSLHDHDLLLSEFSYSSLLSRTNRESCSLLAQAINGTRDDPIGVKFFDVRRTSSRPAVRRLR